MNINPGSKSDFTQTYENPIKVPKNSEIALRCATFWYSWHNISENFHNNSIEIMFENKKHTIKFENGLYDLEDLQDFINDYFKSKDPPVKIELNYVTQRCMITIKSGVELNLKKSRFHELIGFEPIEVTNSDQSDAVLKGDRNVDITRGINHIYIHCSIIQNNIFNSKDDDVIEVTNITVNKGEQLRIDPSQLFYIPLKHRMTEIREIRMRITDQNNNPIDFNGENINYTLAIKFPK